MCIYIYIRHSGIISIHIYIYIDTIQYHQIYIYSFFLIGFTVYIHSKHQRCRDPLSKALFPEVCDHLWSPGEAHAHREEEQREGRLVQRNVDAWQTPEI